MAFPTFNTKPHIVTWEEHKKNEEKRKKKSGQKEPAINKNSMDFDQYQQLLQKQQERVKSGDYFGVRGALQSGLDAFADYNQRYKKMQRVLGLYSMNRAMQQKLGTSNPVETMQELRHPGSTKLQKDVNSWKKQKLDSLPKYAEDERGYPKSYIPQKEEKKERPADFRDWSMAANLLDPKSKMNDWISKRPQKEQEAWSNVRNDLYQQMGAEEGTKAAPRVNVSGNERKAAALENPGSWMGGPSEATKNARKYENAVQDINAEWQLMNLGTYNDRDDISRMNSSGRDATRARITTENEGLKKQQEELNKQQEELIKEQQQLNILRSNYQAGPTDIVFHYGNQYREAYEQYLKENGIEGNDQVFAQFIIDESDKKRDELEGNIKAVQYQLQNNESALRDLDYYDDYGVDGLQYKLMTDKDTREAKRAELQGKNKELQQEIDEIYDELAAGYAWTDVDARRKDIEELQIEIEENNRTIDKIDNYSVLDDEYKDDTSYHPYYWESYKKKNEDLVFNQSSETSNIHMIVDFINGGETFKKWYENEGFERTITSAFSGAEAMLPDEKRELTALYNDAMTHGREPVEAQAFLEGLQPYLNQRLRIYEEIQNKSNAAQHPVMSSMMTGVESLLTSIPTALMTTYGRMTNADWAKDPNGFLTETQRHIDDTEGYVAQSLGPVGGFFYKSFMSMYKNLLRGAVFGGFGDAASAANLTQFYAEAFVANYEEGLNKWHDEDMAGTYAMMDAAISTFFEVASVEKFYSDPANFKQYMLQNISAEMSEEGFEAKLGPYMHQLADGHDPWGERAAEIYEGFKQAGTFKDDKGNEYEFNEDTKGIAAKQAYLQSAKEWNDETIESMASAGISAGAPAAYGGVKNSFHESNLNKEVGTSAISSGVKEAELTAEKNAAEGANIESEKAKARMTKEVQNEIQIITAAQGMKEGTESRALADKIYEDFKKGKVNKREYGKLVRTIIRESSEQIGEIARNTLGNTLKQQLIDKGVDSTKAEELSGVLLEGIINQKTTPEMWLLISDDENAREIWREYMGFQEQASHLINTQKSVMDLLVTPEERTTQNIKENVAAKMAAAKYVTAQDEELKEALAAGEKRTGSALEVVANGKIANVEGFGIKEHTNADGVTTWDVTVKLSNGEEVDIDDVKSTNENAAKVLQVVQGEKGQSIGQNVAMALMQIKNKDMAGAMTDAMNLMMADMFGTAAKVSSLSTKEQEQIRAAIEQDNAEADAKAAKNRVELTPGQGRITYDGTTYGTKAFADKLSGLGKGIRDEANYVAQLMKSIGMNVDFYYNEKESANQGAFYGGKGIRINLAGTFKADGTHRSIVATAGHEATHWLRANSPQAYRKLQAFAMKSLQNAGMNLQNELRHIMDNYSMYGEHLTIDGAAEEMVAMGCEQIFTDEKLVKQLQQEDPRTYGKVRQAVKHVVDMMRNVFSGTQATSSRYARRMQDTLDELGRVWKIAYEAAKGAEGTGDGTGARQSVRFETAEDRIQRFKNEYNDLEKLINGIGGKLSVDDVISIIGEEKYSEFRQWMHNEYEKGENKKKDNPITENKLKEFIKRDLDLIRKYSGSVIEGWKEQNKSGKLSPLDVTNNEITNYGGKQDRINSISRAIFGDVNYKDVENEDTNTIIRLNKNTIKETLEKSNEQGLPARVTEKILKSSEELLRTAKYIGSRDNYTAAGKYVHFYVNTTKETAGNNTYYDAVVFAVHEAVDENTKFKKKVYVEEISLIETKEVTPEHRPRMKSGENAQQSRGTELYPSATSEYSIYDLLEAVNTDQIRYYMKDELQGKNVSFSMRMDDLDQRYADAVARGDWRAAEDMLLEKMQQTEGITGYRAPHFYAGEHKDIARLIKSGDQDVINSIVEDMAQHVPDNAVLVPMPPHEGKVTDSTDTMILAKALSKATGAQVINALESDYHPSRYQAKASGDRSVNAQTMGFRQVEKIPEGMMPVFIDNMVGGGQTAIAAKNAIGRGITLAYAQSSRSKTKGVKIASVTYDSDGNLIQLSQRMDPENPSWKYSLRDDRYMDVVNSGDMETAQWMVDQKAEEAFANSKIRGKDGKLLKVFHGTNADFNAFDTSVSGGINGTAEGYGIYLSDSQDVTEHYGSRQIGAYLNMKRPAYGNRQTIRKGELTKLIKAASEYEAKRIMEEEGYDSIQDALRDTWISGYVYTPGYSNIKDAYTETADKILQFNKNDADIVLEIMSAMGIRDYERAMEFYHDVLTPTTGIDGFWQQWDNTETGEKANIFLAFDSNQIKEADPVTYDDDGNIIPLSERFNTEKKDIRWSMRDDTDYDVRQWMETVPEWSLQTEAEKTLLKKFGNLQTKAKLDRERMRKIDEEIRKVEGTLKGSNEASIQAKESIEGALENAGVFIKNGRWLSKDNVIIGKVNEDGTITLNKETQEGIYSELKEAGFQFVNRKGTLRAGEALNVPGAEQTAKETGILSFLGKKEAQRQLEALQVRKQNLQTVMDQNEEKLNEILSDEGFGRMMYQQQKVLEGLKQYETQGELKNAVEKMEDAVRNIQERISENKKAIEKLNSTDSMKQVREILESTTAKQAAEDLKREYHSTWTQAQILPYISEIMAKMTAGEEYMDSVEELAEILMTSDSRNVYEGLNELKGLTITLGKREQRELKAKNSNIREIRQRLEGTGIMVRFGETSTLDTDVEDLRTEYPTMPEFGNDLNALDEFIDWVNGMRGRTEDEFYEQNKAEATAKVLQKVTGVMKNGKLYVPNDSRARQQIMDLVQYMKGLNAETAEAERTLAEVAAQLEEMKKTGAAASSRADLLMKNVNVALDYYNRISRIAVDEAKETKTNAIIEQLKSKHAEEIVKNNEEWRAQIQRDADSRKQLEENRKYQKQVNTNLKRMWKLLKEPKGLNNIPEYMQGLAREVISMFVNNDMGRGSRFLQATMEELADRRRILDAWDAQDGKFDRSKLNVMDPTNVKVDVLLADVDKITEALKVLNSYQIYGKNKLDVLQKRGAIIGEIRDAVSEIYRAIKAEQEVQMGDRRVAIEDAAYDVAQATGGKTYREWTGTAGQKMAMLHKFMVSGNMTPEYFFRTIGNAGLSELWENYHQAENRNGLELKKAQDALSKIAEEYGYKNWDMKQKITLNLESGDVEITLGQLMSLWATWRRETTLGPAMSEHLTKGGFYAEPNLRDGLLGRQAIEKKAHRVTEADMAKVKDQLTEEQRNFVDAVVGFMSNDMSQLGNEASMAAYGIKLYKESYYFPFQIWNGVKTLKSNDAGSAAGSQDRAFHPSFSKSRLHGANNAIMLGDFMTTAADHIAGMINYATMGLANENLNKVLNAKTSTGGEYDTLRNTRVILEEAYGKEAIQYLMELKTQLEGGAVKIDKTFYDRLISLFRKNAVAGSLSVALQQPLSYLRAAMMIDSKYLARALSPDLWKGSYEEMIAHSGVAVIKDMGRFDMNFGASAREFLMPEGKESTGKKIWKGIEEYTTILPELMDRMTWTRMWSAVKAEQKALHPEMDVKSDEFLDMCGVRFNDIMRRTQVYDSTLVKSANMRNQSTAVKALTSFMAEPTLTLNVIADSVRMAKQGEKGGKMMAVKSSAIFMLSAVLAAAVKGLLGSGRTPDDKKTWLENFMYRFEYNFLNEADPLQLIPGFSDAITILKGGELKDDAYGSLKKIYQAGTGVVDILTGKKDFDYRSVEDSAAQLTQFFSGVPLKNLMRDGRAMYNFISQEPYAKRETSGAVLGGQVKDLFWNADNLFGVVNKWMGEAGYNTSNTGYYQRIYDAKKAGNEQEAQSMIDYLLNGKGVKEETITSRISGIAKKDENASAEDTANFLMAEGGNAEDYIKDQMRDGKLDAEAARELLQKANPEENADSIWWTVDRIQYKLETGAEKVSGNYYRLWDAMDENKADSIREAVKTMTAHGMEPKNIKERITKQYKDAYLEADSKGKVKIKGAIEKAYKELGYSTDDADKVINKWK